MYEKAFSEQEITIDIGKASRIILLSSIPLLVLFGTPFALLHLEKITFSNIVNELTGWRFFLVIIFGIPVHELIHAFFFLLFTGFDFRSIKFGIMHEYMSPYCHCDKPMKKRFYVFAAAAPGILLGIFPAIYAIYTGRFDYFFFGIFYILSAGGDFLMIYQLRGIKPNVLVIDHEEKAGCRIINS